MNLKTRLTATALSATLLVPCGLLTACNKQEAVKTKPTNVYRYSTIYENTFDYVAETGDRLEINNLYGVGNRIILQGYEYDEDWNSVEFYKEIDTTTGDLTDITVPALSDENEWRQQSLFAENGDVWYSTAKSLVDDEGNWSEELWLYHADSAGNVIAVKELYDLFGVTDRMNTYLYVSSMVSIGDQIAVSVEGQGISILNGDLTVDKQITPSNMAYSHKMLAEDDSLLICYYTQNDYKQVIVRCDLTTGKCSEALSLSSKAANNLYNAMPSDTYDFVYSSNIGIYGYDIASDTEVELLNWINSDINATRLRSTYIAPDGTVFTLMSDYRNNETYTTVNRLNRIPDEEVKEKYILSFGTLNASYDLIDAVVLFNRQSEEYRITIRDYSGYNSEDNNYTGALTQFQNDITTGNIPDIIRISNDLPYQNYASKGLFADLYPFIEADDSIDTDDLYENILDALSVGGKLYQIIPAFRVMTLAGKSASVGETDGWTMDDLLAAIGNLPDGVTDPFAGEMTQETFLTNLCTMARDQFIDKDSGTCSFNSPEFIKILEFTKTLPEKTIWDTINWDEVDDSFYVDREMIYRTGEALLMQTSLGNYTSFWEMMQGQFGADIALVGYPNENKQGSAIYPTDAFAISAQSLCKEGAWEFLSSYLATQKTEEADSRYQFSIFRSVNQAMAEYALAYHDDYWYEKQYGELPSEDDSGYVVDTPMPATEIAAADFFAPVVEVVTDEIAVDSTEENNGTSEYKRTWSYWLSNGETLDLGMMTKEAVAHVDAFLSGLSQAYYYDSAMMDIILEEASAFFAGQKTAEEVANLIQNRVFIYVNESR